MKEKIITIFIFLVVVATSFYFGFSRLKNFSGVDEPLWSYGRVPKFWKNVKEMDWANTNISDKPGIPLAIVSGLGLPMIGESPQRYKKLRFEPKTPEQIKKIQEIYFWLRLPVFLFTLAVLPAFYFLVKKILGRNIARLSILFIGLSPILLGISLIINSDAMLWILTALSTLSLFAYLKEKKKKLLFLSGFLLGLSVITKYVANILFVYFFLIFLLEYIFFAQRSVPIGKYLKEALRDYILLFLTALATTFLFFPAAWVKFSVLIGATIGNEVFSSIWPLFAGFAGFAAIDVFFLKSRFSEKLFGFFAKRKRMIAKFSGALFALFSILVFLIVYASVPIFDIEKTIASPKGIGEGNLIQKYVGALTADVFSFLFSVSPFVLIFVLFAAGNLLRKKELKRDSVFVVYVILFAFFVYLGAAVNHVITTVRYQIIVYPLMFIVAAVGFFQFMELKAVKKYVPLATIYIAFIAVLVASLFLARPHFLAYASEILPQKFVVNLKGMGEGSWEAAQYLNSLPDAQNLLVWSDKGAVCEMFVGKCAIDFDRSEFEKNQFDYFVVSADRWSRSLKRTKSIKKNINFDDIYRNKNFVFEVRINRNPNNFVRVLDASQIHIEQQFFQ